MTTTLPSKAIKRLATLIREGAAIHPFQAKGQAAWYDEVTHTIIATCALGAACVAISGRVPQRSAYQFDEMMELIEHTLGVQAGALWHKSVKSPLRSTYQFLSDMVVVLNDQEGWTREQIADWLDSLSEEEEGGAR